MHPDGIVRRRPTRRPEFRLMVSGTADRLAATDATPLNGRTLSGNRYVFVVEEGMRPDIHSGITDVRWTLDGSSAAGNGWTGWTQSAATWDFNGTYPTDAGTVSNAWDTSLAANTVHRIEATVTHSGNTYRVPAVFNVFNAVQPPPPPPSSGRPGFFLSDLELQRLRTNVTTHPAAITAWAATKATADAALGISPSPPSPTADYSGNGWNTGVYQPGLADGHRALALARAYQITGQATYGQRGKFYLQAWQNGYYAPNPTVGHFVAEPVGWFIKAFMAFDLLYDQFTSAEVASYRSWASQWLNRFRNNCDSARSAPWTTTDVIFAPVGNGANWARAAHVLTAAVVGGSALADALAWNWSHTVTGGSHPDYPPGFAGSQLDYGWDWLMSNMITNSGEHYEGIQRQSVGYGMFSTHGCWLIADVARHLGYSRDLFSYVSSTGDSFAKMCAWYLPHITTSTSSPYGVAESFGNGSYDAMKSEFRAVWELLDSGIPSNTSIRNAVTYGGNATRGQNYDGHIHARNAIMADVSFA